VALALKNGMSLNLLALHKKRSATVLLRRSILLF